MAVVYPGVEDGKNVGVRKRRNGLRLSLEPSAPVRIRSEVQRQNLDGNIAIQPRIPGAIHLAHSARSERTDNLIWAERHAWLDAHVCHIMLTSFVEIYDDSERHSI